MTSLLCRRALELGAVSGVFTPEAMAGALGLEAAQADHRLNLWRELSAHVTEVLEGRYGWQLKPDARIVVLTQLISRAQVRQLIDDAPRMHDSDAFAAMLRDLLAGHPVAVQTGTYGQNRESDLLAEMRRAGLLLDAVQFAQRSPAADADRLEQVTAAVKRHIVELRQRRDLLIVLPRRHFGYRTERQSLSRFLRSVDETADERPVFLSGIGGVGKSALHARLFRYWQRRSDGPLTVTLDFDRRQLNTGSPVELLREFLQQTSVGVYEKGFPPRIAKEMGDGLKKLRHGLSEIPADATFDRQLSGIASSDLSALLDNWAAPLAYQPIAVAFDSFESLDRRGGSTVEIVLRLEEQLRRALPRMRSVFAGREEPLEEQHMTRRFGPPERRMRLRGLTPSAGAMLIKAEDQRLGMPDGRGLLDEKDHQRIAEILKGHPLAMLMLVQFAHARPDEIDHLLAELGQENGQFEAEFAQVFLYERILERINDPDVRALAHPGLVLRQLNTDLIREVLATPCLGHDPDDPLTQIEAAQLKEALEREYWLVEADDQGFDLRHRPDLRRMMMPGLFAAPRSGDSVAVREKKQQLTASALDVCSRAAHYFLDGPPEHDTQARARWHALPERLRRAHGLYYASFTRPDDAPDLTLDDARDMDTELGEDVDTMPVKWRGMIKALLAQKVSAEEQGVLDDDLYEQVESAAFEVESKVGRSAFSAGTSWTSSAESMPSPPSDRVSAARLERQIASAFANMEFDLVAEMAPAYLGALAQDDGTAAERFDSLAKQDVTQTPLWKILLVTATRSNTLTDFDFGDLTRKGVPFGPLCEVIMMVARGDLDSDRIANRLGFFVGDVETAQSYRQAVFETFDWVSGGTNHRRGAFAALALAAGRISDKIRPDDAHAESKGFVLLTNALFDRTQLMSRDIQAIYDVVRLSRFIITPELFTNLNEPGDRRMLRGLTPELYEPLITALRTSDADLLGALERLLKEEAVKWPDDLTLDTKIIADTAPLIVEMADRYGLLRLMSDLLALRYPQMKAVVDMHVTLTVWFFPPFRSHHAKPLPGWVIDAIT